MTQRSVVMEGSLDEFDLVSVVQTVSIGRQSTSVELRDDQGAVVGTLLLKAGQIVSAYSQGVTGVEAVRRLLQTPRLRRFYVYRAPGVELLERIGPVTQVLANILTQPAKQPESAPMLMQGSLAQYDLRVVAEAVSLGRQAVGIEVFAPDGRRVGALYLKGGQILFAAWGRSAGSAALIELFKPRKSGRFVVFRSPHTKLGEPIARLADVLYPKRANDSLEVQIEEDGKREPEADDTQVTRVSQPPTAPVSKAPAAQPAAASASKVPPAQPGVTPGSVKAAPPSAPAQVTRPAAPSTRPSAPPARPSAPPIPPAARASTPPSKPAQPPPPPEAPTAVPARPASASTAAHEAPTAIPPVPPRDVVSRSFAPPAAEPAPSSTPSQAPAAPRFRRSDAPPPALAGLLEPSAVSAATPPPTTPIVCVTAARGGTGRTTIALNLAVTLARRGKRVVLVDADQGGTLVALHASPEGRAGAAEVLRGQVQLSTALMPTRMPNLKLLPSGELGPDCDNHPGWRALFGSLAEQADFVLVDCPSGLYGATASLLACATHQLLVAAAEPAARRLCAAHAARLSKLASVPNQLGIVLNMLDYQVAASVRALEELCGSEFASRVLDVTIPRSPAFLEASARGLPIVHAEQGASSTIGWVFETLASALLERLALEAPVFAQPLLA